VAYQTLVRATREHYHARVATALETRFPAIADTQPERLAAHYTEAGRAREAIGYWRSAAERALQRSANREAIGHLTRALALVEGLADPRERVEQELALQLAIRAPLVALQGYTAPEVERACSRARELCQQAGDLPHLVDALLGLQLYYLVRAQLGTAYEIAQSLQRQAEAAGDTAAAARTGPAVGLIQYFMGDLVATRATLERSLDGGIPEVGLVYTTHPRQSALTYLGFTLCLLGYPDQALARIHDGMAFADGLAHPFSRAYGRFYAAMLHHLRGEWTLAGERADQVIAVATEHGFPHWATLGSIVQAAARACLSPSPPAIEQVERGVASLAKTGADLARPRYLGLLAEAHLHLGQTEAGLRAADAALVAAARSDERYFEAELHRLRGALLLGGPDPDRAGAEEAFQRALAIARRQQARFLELRAARSLSALWAAAGRRADARALLDGVYRWFTEGFDTPDLRSAQGRARPAHLREETHGRIRLHRDRRRFGGGRSSRPSWPATSGAISVLLLEAGSAPSWHRCRVLDAERVGAPSASERPRVGLPVGAPELPERPDHPQPHAKVLGGCSGHNAMLYVRGAPRRLRRLGRARLCGLGLGERLASLSECRVGDDAHPGDGRCVPDAAHRRRRTVRHPVQPRLQQWPVPVRCGTAQLHDRSARPARNHVRRVREPDGCPVEPHRRHASARAPRAVRRHPRRRCGMDRPPNLDASDGGGRCRSHPQRGRHREPADLTVVGHRTAGDLGRFGIPMVAYLPGVGLNLQDHLYINTLWTAAAPMPPQPYGLAGGVIFASTGLAVPERPRSGEGHRANGWGGSAAPGPASPIPSSTWSAR
jgi:hypothetical protein